MNIQKCAIVGCGAVGATAAYTLLGSGLFNELILIDINRKKAEGEAMDIGHGVPFIHPVEIYAGTYEDLADAYLVIVTAGANQLPGESRINLTEKNVRIFQSIIPEIVRYNTECLLLIVANPVDILTYTAWPYVCPVFHRRELSAAEQYWILPGSSTVWESISVSTTAMFMHLLLGNMGIARWRSGVQPQYPA